MYVCEKRKLRTFKGFCSLRSLVWCTCHDRDVYFICEKRQWKTESIFSLPPMFTILCCYNKSLSSDVQTFKELLLFFTYVNYTKLCALYFEIVFSVSLFAHQFFISRKILNIRVNVVENLGYMLRFMYSLRLFFLAKFYYGDICQQFWF